MIYEAPGGACDYGISEYEHLSPSDFDDLQRAYMQAVAVIEKTHRIDDTMKLEIACSILWIASHDLPRSYAGFIKTTAVVERTVINVLLMAGRSALH